MNWNKRSRTDIS